MWKITPAPAQIRFLSQILQEAGISSSLGIRLGIVQLYSRSVTVTVILWKILGSNHGS